MATQHQDPAELEREVHTHRRRIDQTLDELGQRLSPGQLVDEAIGMVRRSEAPANVRAFTDNLGRSIRDHPLPVAMIGLGLAWLAASGRNGGGSQAQSFARSGSMDEHDHYARSRAGSYDDDLEQEIYGSEDAYAEYGDGEPYLTQERIDAAEAAAASLEAQSGEADSALAERRDRLRARVLNLRSEAGETAQQLRDRLQRAVEGSRHRMRRGSARMGRGVQRAYAGAGNVLEEQPLVAAALGVSVGALLGACLPRTEWEDETIGPRRDEALREAKNQASRGLHEADHRAAEAYERGRDALAGDENRKSEGSGHA
jgi:ElaB/YqjD/DUF883 family membrane-anchored ribosome-binding protein